MDCVSCVGNCEYRSAIVVSKERELTVSVHILMVNSLFFRVDVLEI